MKTGSALAMHVIPFSSVVDHGAVTVSALMSAGTDFGGLGGTPDRVRMNVDGLVRYWSWAGADTGTMAYTHVFRGGAVESVWANAADDYDGHVVLHIESIESTVHSFLVSALLGLRTVQVSPPFMVCVTLIGMKGIRLLSPSPLARGYGGAPIDRDLVILPELQCDVYEPDGFALLRPLFDALWNAAGYPHCATYDGNGVWRGKA
jgi:hypothetical protein